MKMIRTGRNNYRFINKDRAINAAIKYTVTILALYGAADIILRANGVQ